MASRELLEVWEVGSGQHPIDRALTIVAAASPDESRDALADLSLGEREARLLTAHEWLHGPILPCGAVCPACGTQVELSLTVDQLRAAWLREPGAHVQQLSVDGWELRFGLPTSRDLAAAAAEPDLGAARLRLVERCVLEATYHQEPVAAADLPPNVVLHLADRVAASDPGAETLLDVSCPACGERWQALLDLGAFVWDELNAQALRLLGQVDALARAYGWSEAEILALGPARRRAYLELLGV